MSAHAFESRRYADLAGPEIAEAVGPESILLMPVGAIEQHGPHLPLSVDSVIAEETAAAAAARVGADLDIWLLPTLSVTKSNEHAWSPGTLWLSASTLLSVLVDIGRGLATTGARRVVFLNGHGGNTTLLSTALRELRLEFGLMTFLTHPSMPPAYAGADPSADHADGEPSVDEPGVDELGMGIHGGRDETSVFMHLRPELVDLSQVVRKVPESLAENQHVRFGGDVLFGWLSNDFDPDGYIGDPTSATAARGSRLFDHSVANLCEQLAEIATFEFGR